jgi:hypothetical protein
MDEYPLNRSEPDTSVNAGRQGTIYPRNLVQPRVVSEWHERHENGLEWRGSDNSRSVGGIGNQRQPSAARVGCRTFVRHPRFPAHVALTSWRALSFRSMCLISSIEKVAPGDGMTAGQFGYTGRRSLIGCRLVLRPYLCDWDDIHQAGQWDTFEGWLAHNT